MADTRSARKRVSDAFFEQTGNKPYLPEFIESLIPTLRQPGSDLVERVWAWCRWRGWGNSSRCPVSHWEPERARLLGQLDCAIDLMWFEEGRPVEEIATASQEMRDQEHGRARSRKDSIGRAFRKVQDRGQVDIVGRQIYLLEAPPDRDKSALVAGSRDYQRDRFDKDPEFIKWLTDLGSRDYEDWKEVRTRYLEIRNRLRSRYKQWRDPATNGGRNIIDVIPTNNGTHQKVDVPSERDLCPSVNEDLNGAPAPPPITSLPSEKKAEILVRELAAAHCEVEPPGPLPKAVEQVQAILKATDNTETKTAEIRANHTASMEWWKAERQTNPKLFVPQLWRWFRDGDWMHPPGARAMAAAAAPPGKTNTKATELEEFRRIVRERKANGTLRTI